MHFIPHLITLILCSLSAAIAIKNARSVTKCHDGSAIVLVLLMSLFQISTVATFVTLQFGWVLSGHGELIGKESQLGWIAYDYQNILFHICAGLTVNHWIKCNRC